MVVAPEKVAETVAVVPRPGFQEPSVFSLLDVSDHRRHKEEVNFQPVLHPIRFADTAYIYLNSTKKRFLSRTFYEARIRPRSFSATTYTFPKTADHSFVSYLDVNNLENRKWYKTSIEVKARNFTTEHILRQPGSDRFDFTTTKVSTSSTQQALNSSLDPGASQIYIPKRRHRAVDNNSLQTGNLKIKIGKKNLDFNMNDPLLDCSDA